MMKIEKPAEMYDAIFHLRVRGAPAIGICAGYCMSVLAQQEINKDRAQFIEVMKAHGEYLKSSRPTAVNLAWAVDRIMKLIEKSDSEVTGIVAAVEAEAIEIHEEDIRMCRAISEFGLELVKDGELVTVDASRGVIYRGSTRVL